MVSHYAQLTKSGPFSYKLPRAKENQVLVQDSCEAGRLLVCHLSDQEIRPSAAFSVILGLSPSGFVDKQYLIRTVELKFCSEVSPLRIR